MFKNEIFRQENKVTQTTSSSTDRFRQKRDDGQEDGELRKAVKAMNGLI